MERFRSLKNQFGHINSGGPCGYENPMFFKAAAEFLRRINTEVEFVRVIRGPFTKPRTNGGNGAWYGEGTKIIPQALEIATKYGLIYATEVENAGHVLAVAQAMQKVGISHVLFWIGARNTSSGNLIDIANAVADNSDETFLLCKNSLIFDRAVSEGIPGHISNSRLPMDRLIFCHRGFSVKGLPTNMQIDLNPNDYRNIPDHEWATSQWINDWQTNNIPIIFDPSHVYGDDEVVLSKAPEYFNHPYSGYILEVHPNPTNAKSDAAQQLSFDQFTKWISIYKEFFENG